MESQIMALMGVTPVWDERGRVSGVTAIPRESLGHPRIDVTIVPSGLYRDIFPMLMDLLDQGVSLARDQIETDNSVRANTLKTLDMLKAKGLSEIRSSRVSRHRPFFPSPE
jgi:cobaltochelatase CobN